MQAACDIAFEYAHIRKQFNQPIGQNQVNFNFYYFVREGIFLLNFKIVNSRENGRHVYNIKLLQILLIYYG